MSGVEVIRAAALGDLPHGFLGRSGGVSTGILSGLNTGWGSGDDREAIIENRRRAVAAVLPGARLVTVQQVHSAEVVEAGDWPVDDRPHADALVSDRPGTLLGILTADCAPILLADRDAGVIGAAHAGWRGAVAGVAANTVAAMEQLGAKRGRIVAAVGPCIARTNYEVDHDFAQRLGDENQHFFTGGPTGKPHFDLESFVVASLASAGIARIEALSQDTYAQPERFFSFRRATHAQEPDYGRQLSVIGLATEG
ncbi:peptidoglycan editing factor PgeF [Sphingomonas sp.]|uniref:peptidoglycan editing factor PgeF n=1 Tax=Sphingomonas sp. TaxID=28214 RepID=UPI00286CB140|nr:peptidoglycan editing factor PgeF [Sphingomonas sp.]